MILKIKRLSRKAVMPRKALPGDAGLDLTATSLDRDGDIYTYGTGIRVEIPEGHVGLLFPRSSIYRHSMSMTNSVGVIDSGYRGEIKAKFYTSREAGPRYGIGERVVQLVIIKLPELEVIESDELSDSVRGEGGHGSTGK